MKNKLTISFCTVLLSCCFSLILSAQKQSVSNDFDFSVINYSDKSNFEKEHIHVLELTNNSNSTSSYTIVSISNCGDNNPRSNENVKLDIKQASNIKTEIYLKDLNSKDELNDIVSLKPNESIKIYLKIKQNSNATLGSRNCSEIQASKVSQNKSKISKSITIETLISNPINKGH